MNQAIPEYLSQFTFRKYKKPSPAQLPCLQERERAEKVSKHMPLVYRLAKKAHQRTHGQTELEELVSLGTTGLLQAMNRFDSNHEGGASFSTFAYYRILGAIYDGIGQTAPLTRKNYKAARKKNDAHAIYKSKIPTDQILDSADNLSPYDLLGRKEIRSLLDNAIDALPKKHQYIVRKHYFKEQSFASSSKKLKISKSWASRNHSKALLMLRNQISENGLSNDLLHI